ncbi:MAG: hypothetical protein GKS06_13270 [Acidobacteria bacterium]|nr:hypothetical protein [Acidobacteriota bacterium]
MTGRILHGWPEIANYVHRSVRCAQRWEKERGLPVRRQPKVDGRPAVYALASDLDEWLQAEADPARLSEPTLATSAAPLWRPPSLPVRVKRLAVAVTLVGLLAVAAVSYSTRSPSATLDGDLRALISTREDRIGNGNLVHVARGDEPVGQLSMPAIVTAATVFAPTSTVILGFGTGATSHRGHLAAFDVHGDQLWSVDLYDNAVMTEARDNFGEHSTHLQVVDIFVVTPERMPVVVAIAQSPEFFVSRITAVDLETGDLLGTYWHSGKIGYAMSVAGDVDGDLRDEIVVPGANNGMWNFLTGRHEPTWVLLAIDPEWLVGESQSWPPRFESIPVRLPKWYYFFPSLEGEHGGVKQLTLEDQNRDGTLDVKAQTHRNRYHYIRGDGAPIATTASHEWVREYGQEIPEPKRITATHLELDARRRGFASAPWAPAGVVPDETSVQRRSVLRPTTVEIGIRLNALWETSPVIAEVSGAATRVDLRPGDKLLSIGGVPIQRGIDAALILAGRAQGEFIRVEVLREGQELSFEVPLATRTRPAGEPVL